MTPAEQLLWNRASTMPATTLTASISLELVHHELWLSFVHSCAHFFDERSLVFQLLFQSVDLLLLRLYGAVLFQKFIQQHRVHLVVPHAVGFSFLVAYNSSRIHLF